MNIVVVTWDYPDEKRSVFPFVKNLIDEWAKSGHNCTVIAPYSITNNKGFHKYITYQAVGTNNVKIIRPNYLSFSDVTIGGVGITNVLHKKAVERALKSLKESPDVIYCHFWRSATEALIYSKSHHIPFYVASGESAIEEFGKGIRKELRDTVQGVIAVSSKNKDESINIGLVSNERCIVLPNAYNKKLFVPKDKRVCRTKLGLPKDAFIVCFCGGFVHRKGVKVLSDAIDSLHDNEVKSIFLGRPLGESPTCNNILFQGPVPHSEVCDYYNASDIFVLPTLREGCCNAIIEAMACGLPVVSSDLPFNWDVLNDKNSILIDPTDYKKVAEAISKLKNNYQLREQLAQGALKSVQKLTIDRRAEDIIDFMKEKINK